MLLIREIQRFDLKLIGEIFIATVAQDIRTGLHSEKFRFAFEKTCYEKIISLDSRISLADPAP
jgi:hypothetical protein